MNMMSEEQEPNIVTVTSSGMTMTLDIRQMLTAIDPEGTWLGTDFDHEREVYEPSSLASRLVAETADRGKAFKNELQAAVKDAKAQALAAVQQSAAEVIRETIERSARI